MKDEDKTKDQLINELVELRQRVADLEISETKHKKVEKALRESEEYYRRITGAVTDYIFTVRVKEGRPVETIHNPTSVAMTGYRPEEFAADENLWIRMVHEQDRAAVKEQARCILSGQPKTLEHRIVRKDGMIRWVRNTPVPHYDDQGKLLSYDGLIRDITERKLVEEALREKEERLREVLEHSQDVLYKRNLKTEKYEYISPAIAKITGYTPDEVMAMSPGEINAHVHPEDIGRIDDLKRKVLENSEGGDISSQVEYRMKCKDGNYRWISDHYTLIMGPERRPLFSIAIVRDITERKLAEEEKERARTILESSLSNIPDSVVLLDKQIKFSYVNLAFLKLHGREAKDFIGKTLREISPPIMSSEAIKTVEERVKKRLKTGEPLSMIELDVFGKDNKLRLVSYSAAWIENKKGNVIVEVAFIRDVTERKRMMEELLEYKKAVNSSDEIIAAVNSQYVYLFVNDAFLKYNAMKRDEVLGRTVAEVLGEDLFETTIKQHVDRCLQGEHIQYEMVMRYPNIGERILSVSYYPLKGDNEEITGVVAVIKDITERKRAEEALRVSEERLTLVVQGSSEGIWDWNIQNNSLYWSPRLKESLGYADDELDVDFDTFDSLLHPDDRASVKAAIEAHLRDRMPYDVEERLRTKSGDYRWFHIRGHSIWDEAGNPIRMAGSNIDITERKQAEEALKESEEKYRVQFDEALDAIFIADTETGILINCNKAASELVGRAKSELIGKHQRILHPPEEIEGEFSRSFKQHLKEKEGQALEAKVITENGEIRDVSIKANIIELKGEKIIQGIFRDITDRKRTEEQIKASLKEKEVLLQEIHHRVRNNMQVVSSLLKLQAGKMKDEKIRQAFKESQRRVSAMALVQETLYRSKSMAEIELQKHIPALVDSIYRTFRIKQKVKLHVDIEDIKLNIGQATPLSLVINELISNSFKHAFPEGKGEISVKLHLRGEDKIEVVVSDNGRGMPEDIDYEKTLGLQLVKGLVESQLGGTWDITTEAGTKHTIRFKKKEYFGPSRRLDARSAPH